MWATGDTWRDFMIHHVGQDMDVGVAKRAKTRGMQI